VSRLTDVSDGLRRFQRDAKALDDNLGTVADRELAQLRSHFQRLAARGDGQARQHASLVVEAERLLRESRAQLQLGAAHAQRWLSVNGAGGAHGDAAGGPIEPPPVTAGVHSGDPSDAIYALVHRANTDRLAGLSTDATMEQLTRLAGQLRQGGAARCELATAWQGGRQDGHNDHDARLRDPDGDTTYVVDGPDGHLFQFETDARGHTIRARTSLTALDQPRAERLQREAKRAKGGDVDDDGGHLIANSFGGPGEEINVIPQDWFQNQRGDWRRLEREWRRLLDAGCDVEVEIAPRHGGGHPRPTALVVRWAFRARDAPTPFEWVKDTVTIDNGHAAGPRPGPRIRR
jgi:hypothetical protein